MRQVLVSTDAKGHRSRVTSASGGVYKNTPDPDATVQAPAMIGSSTDG